MPKRFAPALLLLSALLAGGQTAPKPPAGAEPFRFPAIEEFERREKVMQLRNQTLQHSQEYQQRMREINAVFTAMGRLSKITEIEGRILLAIEIQRDLAVAVEGLRDDRRRCLGILELVAEIAQDTTLSADLARYLKGVRDTATDMLREQTSQTNRLQTAARNLHASMGRLPPPPTFVNQLGLTMTLVGEGRNAFYINRDSIPRETLLRPFPILAEANPRSLNWLEFRRFSQWASETESALYSLPTLAQLEAFLAQGGKVEGPVWTLTPNEAKTIEERNMRSRFGITMVTLFDPNQVFAAEPVLSELPIAHYPNLAFHLVTPAETGWRFRWNQLKQTLDD